MANTVELIETKTLTSNTDNVTFSSIPQTYDDLWLKWSTRATSTDGADAWDTILKFNGSAANLTFYSVRGDGSGVNFNNLSDRMLRVTVPSNWVANTFSNAQLYLPRYTNTSYNKTFFVDAAIENTATGGADIAIGGVWASSAAVTSIALVGGNSSLFATNTSVSLYGIKKS